MGLTFLILFLVVFVWSKLDEPTKPRYGAHERLCQHTIVWIDDGGSSYCVRCGRNADEY